MGPSPSSLNVPAIIVCSWFLEVVVSILLLSNRVFSSTASMRSVTAVPMVRNLSELNGDSYGRAGLSHLTVAGAVHHGMKEVEVWLQTFAPGSATPVHKHHCEEVFVILKGHGTLFLATTSDSRYPGKPDEFNIYGNSTFTVPVDAVHQIRNTNEHEDLQQLVIISRPPIKVFVYEDWFTPHGEALELFPYPWDAESRLFPCPEDAYLESSAEDLCTPSAIRI